MREINRQKEVRLLHEVKKGKVMKKWAAACAVLGLFGTIPAQELQHEVTTLNIEVPVRVFDGDRFVSDLTIRDFELFEDGRPQKIDAVYLVKKAVIRRKEELKPFSPRTERRFYLFFEITEYNAKLEDAVLYFVHHVFGAGDELTVVTPRKTYRMKSEALRVVPKQEVVRQLIAKLRADAWMGNAEYRSALQDLEALVRSLAGTGRGGLDVEEPGSIEFEAMELEEKIQFLGSLLGKLDDLRQVEQKKLLDFAEMLKEQPGQKTVFLFYQREFLPKIEPKTLQTLISMNQAAPQIQMTLASYMDFYRRDIAFNVDTVKQAYADSSIGIHFLYFTHPAENIPGLAMEEHSEDIYSAFKEMAAATGGLATSSANPEFLFQKAAEAAENYYLIYYTPRPYKPDGTFRNIRVRVKGANYRIAHRAGYFAD